ncbi:unnamed protein product [Chironomus riparius]|uniref:Uncharacterized protein n=1 Tax=Chironomus riparius TaxID=315576 RepID=A0A9N9S660_9DIPT|nr:unnamed protein product [Chironomus riparius]
MTKFGQLLCILAILQSSSSINLDCSFNTNFHYSIVGKVYRCEIQNDLQVSSPDDFVADSTSGEHWTEMGDHNVTGLFAHSKDWKFMPKNVEKFFENIKLIDIIKSKIQEIHQSDLKPFQKLVYCGFKDNEIQTLETGLFDYNLELELISFWNNRITQVGPNVFDHLTKLTWLYFDENPCLNMRVEDNRQGVLSMVEKVTQNCKTSNSDALKKEIEELKAQFKDLKNAHDSGFTAMIKTTEDLTQRVSELEKNMNEAQQRIKDLESKASNIDNMEVKSMETKTMSMGNDALGKNVISQQFFEKFEN